MSNIIGRLARLGLSRVRIVNHAYATVVQSQTQTVEAHSNPSEDQESSRKSEKNTDDLEKYRISRNIPGKDRADFLAKTLINLGNSKEAVYGTLDSWVAWEESFPIAVIKRALNILEKEQEWHRTVQVIKWMLSKGQGTTMNTYGQLIFALDMDNRSEEAHEFWDKRMNSNLHSVPWQLCRRMIAIYYRNKSYDRLIGLFEELETFNRKPSERSIVNKVASAYELLGKVKEKERVLEKYNYLYKQETSHQKSRRRSSNKKK